MKTMDAGKPHAPNPLLSLLEIRAGVEAVAGLAAWPLLKKGPKGDGHSVLVLPGLLASDGSTFPMRAHLKGMGYDVHGWGMGRNLGPRDGSIERGLEAKLMGLAQASGRKVSLVGQSLGGVFARMLASRHPQLVRAVVTLGSPVSGHPRANNAWRVYEFFNGAPSPEEQSRWGEVVALPKVPSTSICSQSDGVVDWSSSRSVAGPMSENIGIVGSHMGMAVHPAVLCALSDRLSQPEGAWSKFKPTGWSSWMFSDPDEV